MNRLKQFLAHSITTGEVSAKHLFTKLLEIPNVNYVAPDFAKDLFTRLLELEIPNVNYALKVLDVIPHPTVSLYNRLMKAHSSLGSHSQCLSLYPQLLRRCLLPLPHSFTLLFIACAKLPSPVHGQVLHAHFLKFGHCHDVYAMTSLLDMYAKMGLPHLSRRVFDEIDDKELPTWNSLISGYARKGDLDEARRCFLDMPRRNVISWTALISGYSQNGRYREALEMYLEMEREGKVKPNHVTIASVLPACANTGALEVGQRIEAYARANGYFKNVFVCNAVLELYARCGVIGRAMQLFDEIVDYRTLVSWNSMIMGLAIHGRCEIALELFNQMLREGTAPDDVTFVGVILACTHGGMVEKGREIFNTMEQKFFIRPKLEHYGCMVDLLGRAGLIKEAYELIMAMPMKPDAVVWGGLLGACSFHGNVEFAERAAEALFELEPGNPGNYVILSNIYARANEWDGVAKVRKFMKGSNTTKAAGHSSIEEGGRQHTFVVEDKCHPKSDEIREGLNIVDAEMKHCEESEILESIN